MYSQTWLLLVFGLLGISYSNLDWVLSLSMRDTTLPWTSAKNGKICYYFPFSETCSGIAIQRFLGLPAGLELSSWTPSTSDCGTLLEKTRAYAEEVASSLFASSIESAASAGVTDFELLTQIWVMQVGNYYLSKDAVSKAFVTALNSIEDWQTVQCDGNGSLLHDGTSTTLPDFVKTYDCGVLGAAGEYDCTLSCSSEFDKVKYCCDQSLDNLCCVLSLAINCFSSSCDAKVKPSCCQKDTSYPCCSGTPT